MKKLLTILLFFSQYSIGQIPDSTLTPNLYAKIDSLEARLNDKYYTRIPNTDFDNKINAIAEESVAKYISNKLALISTIGAIISFLLGFLAKYYFSETTRSQINERVEASAQSIKNENEEFKNLIGSQLANQQNFEEKNDQLNKERINDIITRIDNLRIGFTTQFQNYRETQDKRVTDFETNIKTQIAHLNGLLNNNSIDLKTKIDTFESIQKSLLTNIKDELDEKINVSLISVWDTLVDFNTKQAEAAEYKGENFILAFENLLKNENINGKNKTKAVDSLMRCYYASFNYDKMVKLVSEYESKNFDLLPQTYLNAAIAYTNEYEKYGFDELKETAITNCNKSIKKMPDYGDAYAIKAEVLLISYVKERDNILKNNLQKSLDDFLYSITLINSPVLKGEFLHRFMLDKKVSFLKNYIEILYDKFPLQLTKIRENVLQQLIKNYEIASVWEKNIYRDLLDEGLNANPNIDGKWEITETPGQFLELINDNYKYYDNQNIIAEGVVFYPPNLLPYAIILIETKGKNREKITKGIYEIVDDNNLRLCLAIPDEKNIPIEFVSNNSQNLFILQKIENKI